MSIKCDATCTIFRVDHLLRATALAESRHFWFRGFRHFVQPLLETATQGISDARILDCGCGTGANIEMLGRYGRAYGFDVFVSRMTAPVAARVRGWASYTWGRGEREAYGRRYAFDYDRRHAVAAVIAYRARSRTRVVGGCGPFGRVRSVTGLVRTRLAIRNAFGMECVREHCEGPAVHHHRLPAVGSKTPNR